jgi:hypothetical protein
MLVNVKVHWGFRATQNPSSRRLDKPRLRKLAKMLDALARKDENLLRRAREVTSLRRQAALELHGICADFVRTLNGLLKETVVAMDPEDYQPDHFRDEDINLFQINARGRVLQMKFEATPELISSEDFRVPYILSGAVRCFNQQLLEQDLIEEQLLFYTVEKTRNLWRFFDARTYRSGPVDMDYLTSLMESLV